MLYLLTHSATFSTHSKFILSKDKDKLEQIKKEKEEKQQSELEQYHKEWYDRNNQWMKENPPPSGFKSMFSNKAIIDLYSSQLKFQNDLQKELDQKYGTVIGYFPTLTIIEIEEV